MVMLRPGAVLQGINFTGPSVVVRGYIGAIQGLNWDNGNKMEATI